MSDLSESLLERPSRRTCLSPLQTRLDRGLAAPSAPADAEAGLLQQLPAMLVCSIMTTISAVTYGGLLFSIPGVQGPDGVTIWLWSTAAAQLAMLCMSRHLTALGTPVLEMIPIMHAIYKEVAKALEDSQDEVLGTCLAVTFLGTFLLGVLLLLSGRFGLARYLRSVPLVVLKGALFGVAIFLFGSALELQQCENCELWPRWALAALLGTLLFLLDELFRSPSLLAAFLLLLAVMPQFMPVSLEEQRRQGWLFPEADTGPWFEELQAVYSSSLPRANLAVVLAQLPALVGMWLTHILCSLMDLKSIEIVTQQEMELDRELEAIGLTNVLSAVLGAGWPCYMLCSQNVTAHKLGGRRQVGMVVLLTTFPALWLAPRVVPCLPRLMAGCVTWWLGLIFTKESVVDIAKHQSHSVDVVIVVLMAALVVQQGFLQAIFVGLLLSLLVFAMQYSGSVGVIRAVSDSRYFRSNRARPKEQQQLLLEHGQSVRVVLVEGYLMFGSVPRLVETVQQLMEESKCVILSCRGVRGLDYSAVLDLAALGRRAELAGKNLVLTELRGSVLSTLRRAGARLQVPEDGQLAAFCHVEHYNMALMLAEDSLLGSLGQLRPAEESDMAVLRSFGVQGQDLQVLRTYFELRRFPAGTVYAAGDLAGFCIGLVRGELRIMQGDSLLEVVSPGAFTGFASMLNEEPHVSSALVPSEALLLVLSAEAFHRLNQEQPKLGNALVLNWLKRLCYEWRDLSRIATA